MRPSSRQSAPPASAGSKGPSPPVFSRAEHRHGRGAAQWCERKAKRAKHNEKAPAAAPGPSREARLSWRDVGGGSAAHPLRPCAGISGAPPANLGLASGLVARCAHYRRVLGARQVARSSDFAIRMVDRLFVINTLDRGMVEPANLRFSEVCA